MVVHLWMLAPFGSALVPWGMDEFGPQPSSPHGVSSLAPCPGHFAVELPSGCYWSRKTAASSTGNSCKCPTNSQLN